MKVRLEWADLQDLIMERVYPEAFCDANQEVTEKVYDAQLLLGKGYYKELFFRGMHIGFGDIALGKQIQVNSKSDFETVEMHFALRGETFSQEARSKNTYHFSPGQHNIIYVDGFQGRLEWQTGYTQMFEVNLVPEFFSNYLSEGNLLFRRFRQAMDRKNNATLTQHNLPITPKMLFIIQEIVHCNRTGIFKKMMIEAKVIELLLLQLEQCCEEKPGASGLNKSDIDKMHHAKEILLTRINQPCSLLDLAKLVGTNEFTLKKGFKEVFGTTVFGYLSDVKMDHAKKLLLEEGLSIGQVAEEVGYKHPHHFSAAFKRKFGMLPSTINKSYGFKQGPQ